MDRFDDGVLIQSEVQCLCSTTGRQQGLMGVGLFKALHQSGPGQRGVDTRQGSDINKEAGPWSVMKTYIII